MISSCQFLFFLFLHVSSHHFQTLSFNTISTSIKYYKFPPNVGFSCQFHFTIESQHFYHNPSLDDYLSHFNLNTNQLVINPQLGLKYMNLTQRFGLYNGGCLNYILLEPSNVKVSLNKIIQDSGQQQAPWPIFYLFLNSSFYNHNDLASDIFPIVQYYNSRIIFYLFGTNSSFSWSIFCYYCHHQIVYENILMISNVQLQKRYLTLNHNQQQNKLCIFSARRSISKCKNLREFVTNNNNQQCFINHFATVILRHKYNFSTFESRPPPPCSTFAGIGWVHDQRYFSGIYYMFPEKEVVELGLYCEKSSRYESPKFWLFFSSFDWVTWTLFCVLSICLVCLHKCNLNYFGDIFITMIHQPISRRRCTWLFLIIALSLIAINSNYEGSITSLLVVPSPILRIATFNELFNQGFKLYVHIFKPNLSSQAVLEMYTIILHEKKIEFKNISELIVPLPNHTFTSHIAVAKNMSNLGAIRTTLDDTELLLSLLSKNYDANQLICNAIPETLQILKLYWELHNHATDFLYKTLQDLNTNGLFLIYNRLWKFVLAGSTRWKNIPSQWRIGLTSNILIAFQIYGICIGICIFSFLIEWIVQLIFD